MVLEIAFSGLIALAKDKCAVTQSTKLRVVLVNDGMGMHRPRLAVDVRSVTEESHPDEVVEMPDGKQLAIWNLEDQLISLVEPKQDTLAIQLYEGNRKPGTDGNEYAEKKPDKDPDTDFSWAVGMYKACGLAPNDAHTHAEVLMDDRLSYLGADTAPVQFAVARFSALTVTPTGPHPKPALNQFAVGIGEIRRSEQPKVFYLNGGKAEQALADRGQLTLQLPDDGFIQLALNNLKDSSKNRTIHINKKYLETRPRTKEKYLTISVSNLPVHIPPYDPDNPEQVTHFKEYLKLLEHVTMDQCPNPIEDKDARTKDVREFSAQPIKCAICSTCN